MTAKTVSPPFSDVVRAARSWSGPSWLQRARSAAADRFEAAGMPTPRDEAWRSTPLPADLAQGDLSPAGSAVSNRAEDLVRGLAGGRGDAVALTFVDGLFAPTLSSSDADLLRSGRIGPVSRELASRPETIRPFVENDDAAGALADLNLAAFRDGAVLVVPDGVTIDREIRLVFVQTTPGVATFARNFVHVGAGARARVSIATSALADGGPANIRTEISLAAGARLDTTRVHDAPARASVFDGFRATVGSRARLGDALFQTGASWSRSEIDVALVGEDAAAELSGAFLASGRQISDVHSSVRHHAVRTTSRQTYRGIASHQARGVFHGSVVVERGANGTDADQSNKNLLLSREAFVHSTPALDILADDVKCRHGSTTGQVDPAQLFYLRSRGLDAATATRVLTRAFVGSVLSAVAADARGWVEPRLEAALERMGVAS